jgi:hypothetical protein
LISQIEAAKFCIFQFQQLLIGEKIKIYHSIISAVVLLFQKELWIMEETEENKI